MSKRYFSRNNWFVLFKRKSFFQKMRVAPKVAPKFFSVFFYGKVTWLL